MGARENKLHKLVIHLSQKEVLQVTILPVFSQLLWNLKSIFSGSNKKLPLVFLQITNYNYIPWKV